MNEMIRRPRVLVITDRYPPEVAGGAEVSLSVTLRRLSCDYDIRVVALSGSSAGIDRYIQDEIDVSKIHFNDNWPYVVPTILSGDFQGRFFSYLNRATNIEKLARYALFRGAKTGPFDRISRISLVRKLRTENTMAWLPMFDDERFSLNNITIDRIQLILSEFKPDILHCDNYRSIVLSSFLHTDCPVIAHVRDNRFFCPRSNQPMNIRGAECVVCESGCLNLIKSSRIEALKKQMAEDRKYRQDCLKLAHRIIVTSTFLEGQIQKIAPNIQTRLVTNPIDDVEYVDEIQRNIKKAVPSEILVVGMLNENKGQRRTAIWLDRLSKRLEDFRIVLAGRGKMGEALSKEAAKAGLADRLHMAGFLSREELYRAYARASVVLVPNIWPEPFGRVPLEAALSRRPVVAFASGGVKETVVDGKTGFLVQPGDESGLLDRLVRVIKDPSLATRMGNAARRRVLSHYSLEQTATALSTTWNELLNEPAQVR